MVVCEIGVFGDDWIGHMDINFCRQQEGVVRTFLQLAAVRLQYLYDEVIVVAIFVA